MNILITGIAGFIGSHLAKCLMQDPSNYIIGIDDFNNLIYDSEIKYDRLKSLLDFTEDDLYNLTLKFNTTNTNHYNIELYKADITDYNSIQNIFNSNSKFDVIVHLAANANPIKSNSSDYSHNYIQTNIVGTFNLLELIKQRSPQRTHFIYASTSSVYNNSTNDPSSIQSPTNSQITIYAATKKCDEIIASVYSSQFGIKTTAIRLFTVYGPWSRPDMAMYKFSKSILNDQPIDVYNYGNNYRDFTYIDDLIKCISLLINNPPKNLNSVYNIGSQHPIKLSEFINILEKNLAVLDKNINKTTKHNYIPPQSGDTIFTYADMSQFIHDYKYLPNTDFNDGVKQFVNWFVEYHKI